MLSITAALASIALLGSAAAQSTTSLFLLGFDSQPLVASVQGSHDSTTTYFVQCAPGSDPSQCGAGPGFTLIEGPSTAKMVMVEGDASIFSMEVDCSMAKSSAVCTEIDAGSQANFPGTTSTVVSGSLFSSAWLPVTVTANDAAVSASTGASATAPTVSATATSTTLASASSSSTTTTTTTTTTSSAPTGSQTPSQAAASTGATSSSSHAGAAPQITANAPWAVGGMAAAVALVAW